MKFKYFTYGIKNKTTIERVHSVDYKSKEEFIEAVNRWNKSDVQTFKYWYETLEPVKEVEHTTENCIKLSEIVVDKLSVEELKTRLQNLLETVYYRSQAAFIKDWEQYV